MSDHEHQASIYVRCRECFMFGTPLPEEMDPPYCGNCHSRQVELYRPACCFDRLRARNVVLERVREAAQGMLNSIRLTDWYYGASAQKVEQALAAAGSEGKGPGDE